MLMACLQVRGQNVSQALQNSYTQFIGNNDLKHATVSLYVVNTATGKPVFSTQEEVGMAGASTLKIVTAATAFSLLGSNYQYKTTLGYTGTVQNGTLQGDVVLRGGGDPTLGSWRWAATKEDAVIEKFLSALKQAGIQTITGRVIADERAWKDEITPDGWSWQDMGNYYGAGARALNWRENQYDLLLSSGSTPGSRVSIAGTIPSFVWGLDLNVEATAGAKGSGDNAYIYHQLLEPRGFVRGTIPPGETRFSISGAMPNAAQQLAATLESKLKQVAPGEVPATIKQPEADATIVHTAYSPELSKICYWFLKKSINLYGESLLKGMAYETKNSGTTETGIEVLQDFWKKQGIHPHSLNIMDGSGLSAGNRITTKSLVEVLLYAQRQPWFDAYFDGFPVINGLKMKSGSIHGVIGYTGIVKNKKGEEFAFAFLVNNYTGSSSLTRRNMWRVLDALK